MISNIVDSIVLLIPGILLNNVFFNSLYELQLLEMICVLVLSVFDFYASALKKGLRVPGILQNYFKTLFALSET